MLDLQSRPARSEVTPRQGRGRGFGGMFFRSALVVALLASCLSLAVIVAPRASADGIGVAAGAVLAPEVVEGAAEVAVGTAVAITPLGWVIIGGTLAAGAAYWAYSTKDQWQPWLSGLFGGGTSSQQSQTPGSGNGAQVIAGFNLALMPPPDGNTERIQLTWNAGSGSLLNAHVAYIQQCQYAQSTGIASSTGGLLTITNLMSLRNLSAPVNVNQDYKCQATFGGQTYLGTPVAFKGGLAGTDGLPNLPADGSIPSGGPANEVMDGSFKAGQFNPKDPGTKYTTTAECIDQYGTKSTISADAYGDQGAVKIPSCTAAGKGHGTGKYSVVGYPPGSAQGTTLYSTTITPDPTKPLCDPSLPSGGCTMSISIDGKPCTVGDIQCENWIQVDQQDSTHTRVSCNEGPYTAVLSACYLLERAYYPGGAPANVANTDGDPSTSNNTDPNGQTIPQPQPVQTGSIPGGAGQASVGTAPNPTTTDSNDCFPSGWGVFNPVEWIQRPVGCALQWAFVPTGTTLATLESQVKSDTDRIGFGPMEAAVAGIFTPLGTTGAGCQGPPVTFTWQSFSKTFYPFAACDQPMATAAAISNALFTMVFIIGGALGMLRALSSAMGYQFSFGRGGAE